MTRLLWGDRRRRALVLAAGVVAAGTLMFGQAEVDSAGVSGAAAVMPADRATRRATPPTGRRAPQPIDGAARGPLHGAVPGARWGTDQPARDAFAAHPWTPQTVAVAPSAPLTAPAPAAAAAQPPPLPFTYIGMLSEGGQRQVWYLGEGDRLHVVGVGDVIDGSYRVEGQRGNELHLRYLPMDRPQVLQLGTGETP
jgi:hypothetical protein